jgi:hypothetical protein
VSKVLTLSPIHLIVPTSFCASGDKMRSIDSTSPVSVPGCRTEVPEKMATSTRWPLRTALPTSTSCWTGCPIRMREGSDDGTNRTRPESQVSERCSSLYPLRYSRPNAGDAIADIIRYRRSDECVVLNCFHRFVSSYKGYPSDARIPMHEFADVISHAWQTNRQFRARRSNNLTAHISLEHTSQRESPVATSFIICHVARSQGYSCDLTDRQLQLRTDSPYKSHLIHAL